MAAESASHDPCSVDGLQESQVAVHDAESPSKPLEAPAEAKAGSASLGSKESSKAGTLSKLLPLAKSWLSDPMNIGLLFWILAVTAAGGIMFMVMVGMLNAVIPEESNRKIWLEASNQVLNALFTLWALLVQPWRIAYLLWVCRWTKRDRRQLRETFSRAGPDYPVPQERRHMAVVVVFLNLNCLLQYCLAGVMWGIRWEVRSAVLVGCLLGSAFGCVAIAGLYCLFSPLGRPKPPEPQMTIRKESFVEMCKSGKLDSSSLASAGFSALQVETEATGSEISMQPSSGSSEPRVTIPINEDIGWQGPLLGCAEDWKSTAGVFFCFCYTFGRNLQTAGFGNKFLHMIMLVIFLLAPFTVCFFAATQVAQGNGRTALAIILSGILISYLGLLYGGYWRSQLVRYFRLPKTRPCGMDCGPVGECSLWLICCCCALCQEVRTINRYGLYVDFHPESLPGEQSATLQNFEETGKEGTNQLPFAVSDIISAPSSQTMAA